jgi:hypothetical protein
VTINTETIQQYIGKTLFDDDGNKIGKIGAVFLDDATSRPEWVTVATGFFGTNESFVPVAGASAHDDGLSVPFSKDTVKDAPNVDVDQGHLSNDEEETLYRHYGLQYSQDPGNAQDESNVGRTDLVQHDADYDDDDATGMSAGPTNRRGTQIDDRSDDDATTADTGRTRLRRWVEGDVDRH